MVINSAAEQWHEVEQTLTTLELPVAPPTTDPQRLLGYVLHIIPRYTEMEMLVTHLRLYALTLEQDLEQAKSHVRLLTREASGERDKKQFLERYAGQVVKERNDLLHSRGSSKKKTVASHFVWHNCCRKNTSYVMDLAPSILALRGEKLHEATKQVEALQEEVWNQALLQKELDNLVKKTQREHDSKVAADRKHIEELEKQIVQRSTLHTNLERKLYEVESVLARYEKTKDVELGAITKQLREAQARIAGLEEENASLLEQVNSLCDDINHLTDLLQETRKSKDFFAEHIDRLSEKCQSLESEVESLQSEIEILQTKDINNIRAQYTAVIERLQKDSAAREETLRRNIDSMKQELKKCDGKKVQGNRNCQITAKNTPRQPSSSQTYGLENKSPSDDNTEDSGGGGQLEFNHVGLTSSINRSSHSYGSIESSSTEQSHLPRLKVRAASITTQDYEKCSSRQDYYKQECQLKADFGGDLNLPLKESDYNPYDKEAGTHASDEVFDWKTFIDSTPPSEPSTQVGVVHHAPLTLSRHSNLGSTVCHEDRSFLSEIDYGFKVPKSCFADSSTIVQQHADGRKLHSFYATNDVTMPNQSIAIVGDEEKTQTGEYSIFEIKQDQLHNGDDEHAYNDLAQDLHQILNGLEQKRKREEERASQVEHALQEFQRLQQGLQISQLPFGSPNGFS